MTHTSTARRSAYHRFTPLELRFIRVWYAHIPTPCLARLLGIEPRKVEQYVYRHQGERWARKTPEALARLRAQASAKGLAVRRRRNS